MSNYGPKQYKLYDQTVNSKRKSRNTCEDTKEKCYSTKIGQLSAKQQASAEAKRDRDRNKRQPVKIYTPEEIEEYEQKKAA